MDSVTSSVTESGTKQSIGIWYSTYAESWYRTKYWDNGGSGGSCRARCYGGYGGFYHNDEDRGR